LVLGKAILGIFTAKFEKKNQLKSIYLIFMALTHFFLTPKCNKLKKRF